MTRKEFLIKAEKAGRRIVPFALMTMPQKYKHYDIYKIGYLDIETSGLKANFDIILSWAILVRDTQSGKTEIRKGAINKADVKYAMDKHDADLIDKRITEELIEAMSDIDCQIGHWFIGKHRHDIPFIRSRCAINSVSGFPKNRMVRYGDTQAWGSKIHNLSSYSLATIGDAYAISTHKTQIKSKDWKLACLGDKKALEYVLHHNIKDCILTYKIHKKIEEYVSIPAVYS